MRIQITLLPQPACGAHIELSAIEGMGKVVYLNIDFIEVFDHLFAR
jgi:hypothetical protein